LLSSGVPQRIPDIDYYFVMYLHCVLSVYEIVYSGTWELSFCKEYNHRYLESISAFHGVETFLKSCLIGQYITKSHGVLWNPNVRRHGSVSEIDESISRPPVVSNIGSDVSCTIIFPSYPP
jgi:hypothetical protein